ncbi:hypothetical protein ACLOJK_013456, partial [Asimina triloba]
MRSRKEAGESKLAKTSHSRGSGEQFSFSRTTSLSAPRLLISLLSVHQEWQENLREEVLKECGTEVPDADKLSRLKLVHMVLQEDMKLGNVLIPKGTEISIPIAIIQRNKKYWGDDANEFKPLRFADGIAKAAKHPNALLAFSTGPRSCIGQNFAMTVAKT